MKHKFCITCMMIFVLLFNAGEIYADGESLQVAFIRQTNLWVKVRDKERQLTFDGNISGPKWSNDGKWLAYRKGKELWAYHLTSNKHFRLYQGEASNYQWSPTENKLAFQIFQDINVINVMTKDKHFNHVAQGVGNYSWAPDGKEFLASSIANLLPTGWTSVELYNIPIDADKYPNKIKHFYTLPKQSSDFFAVQTSQFKWSSNGMWIAFLAIPTASWSMDSNTLCIIRKDGTNFAALDHMILNEDWFKWAQAKSFLGYIGGEGRMAVENKHLNIKVLPTLKAKHSYTPNGYVDWDFTWQNPTLLTVSRAKEEEWSNDPKKRPLPALYQIDTKTNVQKKITLPNQGFGDYNPNYISKMGRITWLRSNRETTELWMANKEGKQAKAYIDKIDTVDDYYEKRNWEEVIDIYNQ